MACDVTESVALTPKSAQRSSCRVALDWNQLRPNIGEQVVRKLLVTISTSFDGVVFLATTGPFGQLATVYCSDEAWTTVRRLPPALSSGLLEATVCQSIVVFSPENQGLSRVLSQVVNELGGSAAFAISVPLDQSHTRCGLLLVQKTASSAVKVISIADLVASVAHEIAPWMDAFLLCQTGQRIASWKKLLSRLKSRRTSVIATIALFFIMSLAIPIPYCPKRECSIEPATRQFIASPIAGRIEKVMAKPGDAINQGQLLARLHGGELQLELSSAQAELEAASKKKDVALATGAAGNMRIAQLEQQQIALRIESINEKLKRLDVCSPMDGIIVQGDWSRRDGAPIELGDTLFEIAPLGHMTVEAHLHTEDLPEVETGDSAILRVDSAFGHTWRGELSRIDPRARVVDNEVVFIAEMTVENDMQLLRPGTRGSVRIATGTKSFGWLLFSRPYYWLMKKVVW